MAESLVYIYDSIYIPDRTESQCLLLDVAHSLVRAVLALSRIPADP